MPSRDIDNQRIVQSDWMKVYFSLQLEIICIKVRKNWLCSKPINLSFRPILPLAILRRLSKDIHGMSSKFGGHT